MAFLILFAFTAVGLTGCFNQRNPTSDEVQRAQQEAILREGTQQVGMPAIKNFRERKILKDILELRDQDGLVTYTYIWSDHAAKLIFLGETIGYGIPYATQFTNPQKAEYANLGKNQNKMSGVDNFHPVTIPQADPNGLFSPATAEGTWVLLKDPNGDKARPVYVEPRIVVSPFKLQVSN